MEEEERAQIRGMAERKKERTKEMLGVVGDQLTERDDATTSSSLPRAIK